MELRWPSVSPVARRRRTAILLVAAAALAAGFMVGASHGSSAPHRTPAAPQANWRAIHRQRPLTAVFDWRPHRGPVPILMYHVIDRPRPSVASPLLHVRRRTFAAQMSWLDRHGFEAVTLDELEDAWYRGGSLPRRPIVVSFDDGYRSQYTAAMPILRRHGWPGVLSLTLANMNEPGDPITPSRVQGLIRAGWELASHTISHTDLRTLSRRALRHEVRDSRRILRYVFRVPVDNFNYPAGLYNRRVEAAVGAAGYRGAITVTPGLATRRHRFELRRVRVVDGMKVRGLAAELKDLGV